MNGELVYGWSTHSNNSPINLHVPLENVNMVTDMGREGIEIDIKRANIAQTPRRPPIENRPKGEYHNG